MNEDPGALVPELCLAAGAVVGLLVGAWLPRNRQWIVRALAAAACLAGTAAAALAGTGPAMMVFGTTYAVDDATTAGRIIVLAATLLVIVLSTDTIAAHHRETEFYVLLQLGTLGTIVLTGANDLLLLFAGYLLASIPLYALAGFAKNATSVEAALKYYLTGALLGVVMLAGITLIYGSGRSTSYPLLDSALTVAPHGAATVGLVAVLAGLLFKIGGVPAHFWVPDVTDGTPAPVAALVTTVPKIGGLVAAYRLLDVAIPPSTVDWPMILAVVATVSMTLGNLAAFFQTSVQRLLAYSTISQAGYLLVAVVVAGRSGLALPSLLFYLAGYAVTNLGAFAVVAELPAAKRINDYRGLARRHPGLAAVLVVCLLGLVGTPPTAVFIGKLTIFSAGIEGGYAWLVVIAIINTIASLFYYLRWIAPTFLRAPPPEAADPLQPASRWSAAGAYAAAAASLALGLAAGAVLPLVTGTLLR